MGNLTELGERIQLLKSKLTVSSTETVRHRNTGEVYTVTVYYFDNRSRSTEWYVGATCPDDPAGTMSMPYTSKGVAHRRRNETVTNIGGRRYNNVWVLCSSSLEISGWKNIDWPGECGATNLL